MIDFSSAKLGDKFYNAYESEGCVDGIEIEVWTLYKRDEKYSNYLYFTIDLLSGRDKGIPRSGYPNLFPLKATKQEAIFEVIKGIETKLQQLKDNYLNKYEIWYKDGYYHGCDSSGDDLMRKCGSDYGYDFRSACIEHFGEKDGFDAEKLTWYKRKLYSTEAEARNGK